MKHGRPSPLRPNHYIDDIETGCKCPACMLGSGWRREHAHRVFAAIQAVAAVVGTAASNSGLLSGQWHRRLRGVELTKAAGWLK